MNSTSRFFTCAAAALLSSTTPLPAQNTTAESATMSAGVAPEGGRIVVEAHGVQPKAPLFFAATAENTVQLSPEEVTGEIKLKLHILQGHPEVLTLALGGEGEVLDAVGNGLRDWAVRQGTGEMAGKRFLDLRPALEQGKPDPKDLEITIHTRLAKPAVPGTLSILLVMPGQAAGFSSTVKLEVDPSLDLRVTDATGMLPFGEQDTGRAPPQFYSAGDGKIVVELARRGAQAGDAEMTAVELQGKLDASGGSVNFRLQGQARAGKAGARLPLLSGHAGLSGTAAGDGWHVELVQSSEDSAYDLVFDRAGEFPLALDFAAAVRDHEDWHSLDFQMPAGAVVPVTLEGLAQGVTFNPADPVVPGANGPGWRGFLPASGKATLSWKQARAAAEGTLFFTGSEEADVRIGEGLLRQTSRITLRVLQGKMTAIRMRLDGPGEVLGVEGPNVVGWKVLPGAKERMLEVQISRPIQHEETLTIQTQSALGAFPVRAEPVRWTPEGAVRHSGYIRVANSGAVRLEVTDAQGLMQLAPAQFPGGGVEGEARQVFVYRFASAEYSYRVLATQILPEVNVSQVTIYELGETDRAITSDLELDIREAPLREWSLTIPEDYAVVTVSGNDVADYVAETAAHGGTRNLKVLFDRAVDGRQLVHLRLEKNQPAAAGDWQIPPLGFPDAKSVRGHVGIVSAPGYRITPVRTVKLVELPLSYFPQQTAGLQQAYRLHDPGWTAALKIEALSQSVQADVFHLYTLKEGMVYGSVLLNYFVVGAPANEWRIQVPKSAGNIDVVGQGVQRDWRREGDEIVVALHEPVLGPATLLVTFEQPMSARGGAINPGEVRPLGVQAERGFIQVVSPLQVKFQVQKAEGLLKLDPLELPPEFRLLTSAPPLAIYQYTARPFQLAINIEWYPPSETVDQVVDFAKLSSQVSRDGQVVTDAHIFVKTRGRKALRMILPPGVKLWEARADNEVVNARADGDQTLIPLPPRTNPNEPVEVTLRLGQASGPRPTRAVLTAPTMLAPTVISEWVMHGDPGRLLVPKGGTAQMRTPNLTESGFEWLSARAGASLAALFVLIAASGILLRGGPPWKNFAGLLVGALAFILALILCASAISDRRVNSATLSYAATVVPAGETVTVEVANVTSWQAMISWWGVIAGLAGAALLALAFIRVFWGEERATFTGVMGLVLLSAGVLAQRGGAIVFLAAIAAGVFLAVLVPGFRRLAGQLRLRRGLATAASALVVAMASLAVLLASSPAAMAKKHGPEIPASQEGAKPAEAMIQSWKIEKERLYGEINLTVRGVVGDSFLLLKEPAVLTGFEGDGLRVTKVERGGQTSYFVTPVRDGLLSAHVKFEMPAPNFGNGIGLPTGPAAVQRIGIQLDEGGWEITSPMAVQALPLPGLGAGQSGATLVLGPSGSPRIDFHPKSRDLTAETTEFFAELANLYIPGPGVVNGSHYVTIRPAQGRVSELEFTVPAGFTVGEVHNGPVGEWRFDPQTRKLHVAIEPAQTAAFTLTIETQLGTAALPVQIALEPLKITGASGEVGTLALAFGNDAQPEEVKPSGLSPANLEDFDANRISKDKNGQPIATLQQVYRYSGDGGRLALKVAPVPPEVRVTTKEVFSLGDDRLVVAADLQASITRAGIFKLSFVLPEGLEVESLSGAALSQWTEEDEAGQHVVTMHLSGRTMGVQDFSLTLSGAAPHAQPAWAVPRLGVREATRQTGQLLLVPEKGIQLSDAGRQNASQLNPRDAGGMQPGTLAFRLLQQDWSVKVAIEARAPWVTVQALQEVTMREGQTLTRLSMRYRVENAAVKQVRVTLPGLTGAEAGTVRATGPAVKEMVKVAGNLWEIRFQRGIAGETDVQIEFQGETASQQDKESILNPGFEGAQAALFVAVRSGGRLELEANDVPRGWQRLDWSAVPAFLQNRADRSVPAFCFRVAEPERPLAVTIHRHEVADALKLRVIKGDLTTIFSPRGPFLTAAELQMEVVEKTTMRIRLPEKAQLFNTFVNGESVSVVREDEAYLFNVSPNSEQEHTATVRLVYLVPEPQRGPIQLNAPALGVPLENVSWRVLMPPGLEMKNYQGDLRLKEKESAGRFSLADYRSQVVSKRAEDSRNATALLEKADALLQQGDQEQAGEALNRAANANGLDEASNEDARVQLRTLKTQQALLGLNTRRQKLYLDNRAEAQKNGQLEEAATMNPFMQGKTNYDPQQFDQLLQGNTVEENTALRGIAGRLVDQQLGTEPAPSAIDVTLPQHAQVLTFIRSLQVNGSAPLKLELDLRAVHRAGAGFVCLLLLGVAAVAGIVFPRRTEGEV